MNQRSPGVVRQALVGAALLACALGLHAADATAVHQIRMTDQRPPCSADGADPAGMPITPNDPATITLPGGTRRCYGTSPPEMELWLPDGRFAWLSSQADNPAAWIAVGPVLVDPADVEQPPLGLRVTASGEQLALETRYGPAATLTPIQPGRWQEVHSADGRTLWVRIETGH